MENKKKIIGFASLALLASLLVGCGQINPGEVGFKTSFGEIVSRDVLHEGLWWFSPIGGDLVVYDCKNHIIAIKTEQYTKDIQQCVIHIAVTYSLDTSKVIELHTKTGKDYENKLIRPCVMGSVKDVMGQWEATDIIAKRQEATNFIINDLRSKLGTFGINVTFVEVIDIAFTDVFEKAVEAKQVAQENAKTAKNRTIQVEEESRQRVIMAESEAKSMEIRAKALEANKSLVEYEAVMKWDGKLPVYMMGDSVPFINLSVKGAK